MCHLRWECRDGCRHDFQEGSSHELQVFLILYKIMVCRFSGVEVIAMARWKFGHSLDEGYDKVTQIAVTIYPCEC